VYGVVDRNPVINNSGQVVWERKWLNNDGWTWSYDIPLYDSGTVTSLGITTHVNVAPRISDTGHVVWKDVTSQAVMSYDGNSTNSLFTYNYYKHSSPSISRNGTIAWWAQDANDFKYRLYVNRNGNTTATEIGYWSWDKTTPYSSVYGQEVNNRGDVVWMGAYTDDIVMYNGTNSSVSLLSNTVNPNFDDFHPHLNDSGEAVWLGAVDNVFRNWDIFYYDGTSARSITGGNPDEYDQPVLNNSGQIAYIGPDTDPGGLDKEVFLYDIATGTTTQITHDDNWQHSYLSINDYGQIAWVGMAMDLSTDDEVFVWDGSQVIQLTNDDYNAINTSINNLGQVVWENYDPTPSNQDWEIMLATPVSPPVAPEPVSSVLFISGAGTLWIARRKKYGKGLGRS